MNNKKIKLPYGRSEFDGLINQNYYYVDRTNYIKTLEGLDETFILFIRPRRFGKSLFVSTLQHYYDIKEKENFEKYFGNYYIGKNPTSKRNTYLILKFDFSGINTLNHDTTLKGFYKKVQLYVEKFLDKYEYLLNLGSKKRN